MRKLSDEEKAELRAKIEESQERKTDRTVELSEEEMLAIIIVTAIFAILGGIVGFLFPLCAPDDYYYEAIFVLVYLVISVPVGAIAGAIIGLLLSYIACWFWRRR